MSTPTTHAKTLARIKSQQKDLDKLAGDNEELFPMDMEEENITANSADAVAHFGSHREITNVIIRGNEKKKAEDEARNIDALASAAAMDFAPGSNTPSSKAQHQSWQIPAERSPSPADKQSYTPLTKEDIDVLFSYKPTENPTNLSPDPNYAQNLKSKEDGHDVTYGFALPAAPTATQDQQPPLLLSEEDLQKSLREAVAQHRPQSFTAAASSASTQDHEPPSQSPSQPQTVVSNPDQTEVNSFSSASKIIEPKPLDLGENLPAFNAVIEKLDPTFRKQFTAELTLRGSSAKTDLKAIAAILNTNFFTFKDNVDSIELAQIKSVFDNYPSILGEVLTNAKLREKFSARLEEKRVYHGWYAWFTGSWVHTPDKSYDDCYGLLKGCLSAPREPVFMDEIINILMHHKSSEEEAQYARLCSLLAEKYFTEDEIKKLVETVIATNKAPYIDAVKEIVNSLASTSFKESFNQLCVCAQKRPDHVAPCIVYSTSAISSTSSALSRSVSPTSSTRSQSPTSDSEDKGSDSEDEYNAECHRTYYRQSP